MATHNLKPKLQNKVPSSSIMVRNKQKLRDNSRKNFKLV
jgi:hypothetical protein